MVLHSQQLEKSQHNSNRKCHEGSRRWQNLIFAASAVATVSLILNIISLSMIFNLKGASEATFQQKEDETGTKNNDFKAPHQENKIDVSKDISSIQRKVEKILETIESNANKDKTIFTKLNKEIEEVRKRISLLEGKADKEWKRGCPKRGLTNGNLCYVLQEVKTNYTTAVASCKEQNGALARIPNLQILEVVTNTFSSSPFFVDGRYNQTVGKWMTNDGNDAEFLPWQLDQPGTGGDCVYAYRGKYKSWHCYATFEFLCEF